MDKKINVLEVNNVDLTGRRFNGYDIMQSNIDSNVQINQIVIYKQSKNINVKTFFDNYSQMKMFEELNNFEKDELSVHSNLSLTSPALLNKQIYKDAEVLHFHMFHNTKLSLISLLQMCNEKKVVISIHDPWTITGRCVHFGDCEKWRNGCKNCQNLNSLFQFKEDNCNSMWKLKEMIYKKINPEIVVSSKYMYDLIKQSPLTNHFTNIHIIPFGVDLKFFSNSIEKKEARKKFNIPDDNIVIFLRAQNELKGTKYVVEALKKLEINKKITIIACDERNRFEEIKNKYNIIELGQIKDAELLYAYNACDIFLMPSTGETFGMMAVEAMACEKPVIIFNNTALPEVTFAPECGVLVENKNATKLMEAIKYLIENPDERIKRGKLGRKTCEENYDIDLYNKKLINLYKNIRKKSNTKTEEKIEENNQVKNIKYELNKFTKKNFSEKSFNYNKLFYLDAEKNDIKIDYSDINVQKTINNYNNMLYETFLGQKTNNLLIQIKNATNLLIHDRKRLKNSIQYKIEKFLSKKD